MLDRRLYLLLPYWFLSWDIAPSYEYFQIICSGQICIFATLWCMCNEADSISFHDSFYSAAPALLGPGSRNRSACVLWDIHLDKNTNQIQIEIQIEIQTQIQIGSWIKRFACALWVIHLKGGGSCCLEEDLAAQPRQIQIKYRKKYKKKYRHKYR